MDAPRIVVVDDNPEFLEEVGQLLADEGYDPVCCLSTSAASARLRERQPALVITELRVEQVFAGLTVVRTLHGDPATERVPIILWSEDLAALARVNELNGSTVTTVLKPLAPRQLLELVAEHCAA